MASSHQAKAMNRIATLLRDHPALFKGRPFEISGPYVGAGWLAIADAMCCDIEATLGDAASRFRAVQAKEKWGSWRFYWRLEAGPGEDPALGEPKLVADAAGADSNAMVRGVEVVPTPAGFRMTIPPAGELRRAVHERVRQAEQETERTCMWCGAPAAVWTTGWVHVACPRHRRVGAVTLEEAWRLRQAPPAEGAEP